MQLRVIFKTDLPGKENAGNWIQQSLDEQMGAFHQVLRFSSSKFGVGGDFDQDGDTDFGVISVFPDYKKRPELSFVYLENNNAETFNFTPHTFKDSNLGRWFLMDTGDVDEDGDVDIILSSFTYTFTPVPRDLAILWNEKNIDIMLLENKLK